MTKAPGHGDFLTIVQIVTDPIYFTEPYIQSTDFGLDAEQWVESADQPELVLLGVWHHAQVVASFRCPAWNVSSVNAPSSW